MCDKCDHDSDEENASELDAVKVYSHFLEQGIHILASLSEATQSSFLQKKVTFFKEEFDNLEDITIIDDTVFENASDIPELMRRMNPKEYQKVITHETARRNVNSFLDEV